MRDWDTNPPTVAEEWAKMKKYTTIHWVELGYPEKAARALASGKLPKRLRQWPAAPRYRVVELEIDGMATEDAVAKAREEWASCYT